MRRAHRSALDIRHSALVILCLCLFPLLPASFAAAQPRLVTHQSPHYTVHTNLPKQDAAVFALHMNRVFNDYRNRFKDFRQRGHGEMDLYLFDTQQDYEAFLRSIGIDASNTGGMFFIAPAQRLQGLAVWTEGPPRSAVFATLQHEGFHQFAYHYIGPDLPIWVNEGLAQYFEDGVMIRGRLELGLADADRIEIVRAAIQSGDAFDIDHILNITHQQWNKTLAADLNAGSRLYAQAWSMVYFMLHVDNGAYRQQMARYLELLNAGRHSERAFRKAYGVDDLSRMEHNWRRFALQQQPDPVNLALTRLQFFGAALRFMARNDERLPRSFGQLRHQLQQRQFQVQRSMHGVQVTLEATNDELFRFKRADGGWGRFVMLEPARDDLPPRISAVGLRPEPTLVWSRDESGELVQDVQFR